MAEAERVYGDLRAAGYSVLFDDRDVSPGVKFADADLVGVPTQLVVGAKGVARGVIERKKRATGERRPIRIFTIAYGGDADQKVLEQIANASGGKPYVGDPKQIEKVYIQISSFF